MQILQRPDQDAGKNKEGGVVHRQRQQGKDRFSKMRGQQQQEEEDEFPSLRSSSDFPSLGGDAPSASASAGKTNISRGWEATGNHTRTKKKEKTKEEPEAKGKQTQKTQTQKTQQHSSASGGKQWTKSSTEQDQPRQKQATGTPKADQDRRKKQKKDQKKDKKTKKNTKVVPADPRLAAAFKPLPRAQTDDAHAAHMIRFPGVEGATRKGGPIEVKKGRQRLGPRKKRLSTLKKRVLQERLRVWRESNGINASEAISEQVKAEDANEDVPGAVEPLMAYHTVCLRNFVTDEEELADGDEYDEIVSDLLHLASKIGPVAEVYIPRPPVEEGEQDIHSVVGLVFVRYEQEQDARAALASFDALTIGGGKLEPSPVSSDGSASGGASGVDWRLLMHQHVPSVAIIHVADAATPPTPLTEGDASGENIIVALENILSEDDFEDSDCLAESVEDIRALVEQFGTVVDLTAHIDGESEGQVHVAYEGAASVGQKAASQLNGMVIGGSSISARVLGDAADKTDKGSPPPMLILENILTEDDLEDEDCLQESVEDILSMCKEIGEVASIKAHTEGPNQGQVHVLYTSDSDDVAKMAVEAFDGRTVGGETIRARLDVPIVPTDGADTAASTNHKSETNADDETPKPMFSGDKVIPERYAECKRAPKVPTKGIPRAYATKIDDDTVIPLISEMLGELMRLQIRSKDDKNARARRRLVMGLREVARGIKSHKVKMVIMADNLDEYGAIDDKLQEILDLAEKEDVPVFFELSKRRLGKALGKTIKVAVVGIYSADGAHPQYKQLQKIYLRAPRKAPPNTKD